MEDAVKGERRKAAAAADGAQRRPPLVPSKKNNAAAPAGGRREIPSRFKPAAPPAAPPAERRRCASRSPGRASAVDGSMATCNRARSADRARTAAPSAAAPSSRLKPSALAAARSSSPAAGRDATAEAHGSGTPPRTRNSKASDSLWASSRSSSPSVRPRPEPVQAAAPAKKDKRAHGLPPELTKLRSGAAVERNRSPLRGRTNNIGGQCENARPPEPPANRVIEQHRWPRMTTGRGGSAGLTSTSSAPAEKATKSVSSRDASVGHSPRRMHPSEGTGKSLKRPSNEAAKIVHRRRKNKADSSSDTSSQTSESSKSNCRLSKGVSSSVPVLHRSSSPRQGLAAAASTSRSCQSPSRMMRPSAPCQSKCAPSDAQSGVEQPVLSYIVDARKGKKNAGQIENIHQLRLLNNRYLQWRLVNAHSEDTLSQKNVSEMILYSVWKAILSLRDALTRTRINVQHQQQELSLHNILTEQIGYLEQWLVLEEESTVTIAEAIEALQATTLCLPVTSGAQADGVAVRNAISSAVDVMQALSSTVFYLQSKVGDRTSLVSELSVTAKQEKVALDQCKDLLAKAAKLQVQETSLHTHLMQLRERSTG